MAGEVEGYLEAVSRARRLNVCSESPFRGYVCLEELVLAEGRDYKCVLSAEEHGRETGEVKECFKNACLLAMREPEEMSYVEGYASSGLGIAVLHAWCVDGEGRVVDPTWTSPDMGEPSGSPEYRGIALPRRLVTRAVLSRGYYGVLDDYQNGFPALQLDPFSVDALEAVYEDLHNEIR